jgi:predicted transcriptional regulator of viral defense system
MTTFTRPELAAMAAHDVITGDELRSAGVSRGSLRTLLRRAHLFRAHEDVFFVTDRPSREGRWLAAVRRCGECALLSFWSAAVLWRLVDEEGDLPHVTVPHHRGKHPPAGIHLHRTTRRDPGVVIDGIPVTTLHRTIDDIARGLSVPSLKAAVGRAERLHVLDFADLYASATSAKLKRVLATYVAGRGLTDSELEARFFEVVARTSLLRPQMQRRRAGGRVDFLWPELRLVAEVDGYGTAAAASPSTRTGAATEPTDVRASTPSASPGTTSC